jgi:hypothetical protein
MGSSDAMRRLSRVEISVEEIGDSLCNVVWGYFTPVSMAKASSEKDCRERKFGNYCVSP